MNEYASFWDSADLPLRAVVRDAIAVSVADLVNDDEAIRFVLDPYVPAGFWDREQTTPEGVSCRHLVQLVRALAGHVAGLAQSIAEDHDDLTAELLLQGIGIRHLVDEAGSPDG